MCKHKSVSIPYQKSNEYLFVTEQIRSIIGLIHVPVTHCYKYKRTYDIHAHTHTATRTPPPHPLASFCGATDQRAQGVRRGRSIHGDPPVHRSTRWWCLLPRDTSPHQGNTGTAPSDTPPPAQPPPHYITGNTVPQRANPTQTAYARPGRGAQARGQRFTVPTVHC